MSGGGEPAATAKLTFQAAKPRPMKDEIFQVPVWILNSSDLRNVNRSMA